MVQQEGDAPSANCKDALLWWRGAVQEIGGEIAFCSLGNLNAFTLN